MTNLPRSAMQGVLIGSFVAAAACSANPYVPIAAPTATGAPVDMGPTRLLVRNFNLTHNGKPAPKNQAERIKRIFLSYLMANSSFAQVANAPQDTSSLGANDLLVDVAVETGHTASRTWVLDFIAGAAYGGLMWPIVPQWGDAYINLQLTATNRQGGFFTESVDERAFYWMAFYAWFRTQPVEVAYEEAYTGAFQRIAQRITERKDALLELAGGSSDTLFAQSQKTCERDRRKVAVLPLQARRVEKDLGAILDQLLVASMENQGCFDVISSDDINAMLGFEQMKDVMGCNDAACAAEIGGALGVQWLLTGSVGKLGDQFIVSLTLIDTIASEVKARITDQIPAKESELGAGLREVVSKLLASDLGPKA